MKPGTRLHSAVSDVVVVVVRPSADSAIACGGVPMTADKPETQQAAVTTDDDLLIGKRYHDPDSGVELLCVKGGAGPVTVDGRTVQLRAAKQLPSSD
jgi:hypothetical protein